MPSGPCLNPIRHEKVSWGQDPGLPDPGVCRGDLRQGRQTQRDDGRLGRHLLFPAPLRRRLAAQGHLHGICCSQPPCVAVSLRKATYTHGNIVERRAFTISIPSEAHVSQADYLGLVSGRSVDKFAAAKLTPVKSDLVDAPYVKEFPLVLECRLVQAIELGLHTQFVGEILDVKAEESVLDGRQL